MSPRYEQDGRRYLRTEAEGIEDLVLRGDVQYLLELERAPGDEIDVIDVVPLKKDIADACRALELTEERLELVKTTAAVACEVMRERVAWLDETIDRVGPRELVDAIDHIVRLVTAANASDEVRCEAIEISTRARHRAGKKLAELVRWGGNRRASSRSATWTLKQAGITKNESSRWQTLAELSDEALELVLKQLRTEGNLSEAAVLRAVKKCLRQDDVEAAEQDARTRLLEKLRRLLHAASDVSAELNEDEWRIGLRYMEQIVCEEISGQGTFSDAIEEEL